MNKWIVRHEMKPVNGYVNRFVFGPFDDEPSAVEWRKEWCDGNDLIINVTIDHMDDPACPERAMGADF